VIEILKTIAAVDREHRYALRPVLQDCKVWFDDDVDPEVRERTLKDGHGELLPERVSDPQAPSLTFLPPVLFIPVSSCIRMLDTFLFHLTC
jgi:hypothetical protein